MDHNQGAGHELELGCALFFLAFFDFSFSVPLLKLCPQQTFYMLGALLRTLSDTNLLTFICLLIGKRKQRVSVDT